MNKFDKFVDGAFKALDNLEEIIHSAFVPSYTPFPKWEPPAALDTELLWQDIRALQGGITFGTPYDARIHADLPRSESLLLGGLTSSSGISFRHSSTRQAINYAMQSAGLQFPSVNQNQNASVISNENSNSQVQSQS